MSETAQTRFRYKYFNCLIIRLDCIPFISDSPREFSDSHKLLKEVESVSETRFDIYPVILSQSLLGLLINAPEDDNHSILLFYENLIAYLEANHKFVLTLGGTISGENGDGRLRTPYLEAQIGVELYGVMKKVKIIFDPYGTLNPGVKFGTSQDDIKAMIRSDYTLDHLYDHLPRN